LRHNETTITTTNNSNTESVLKYSSAICIGLVGLGVAAASPAHAQATRAPTAQMEPSTSEILMVVRASGLTPLTQPARRGPNFVVLASDNMGGQLNVVIGPNRRILHASPANDPRFADLPQRPRGLVPVAPPPPQHYGLMSAPPPVRIMREPPRQTETPAVPDRSANAPDHTGSVPQAPTPVPRPRPAVAANQTAAPEAPVTPPSPPPAASIEQPAKVAAETARKPTPPKEVQLVPVAPLE
jgi:hypothetical protein